MRLVFLGLLLFVSPAPCDELDLPSEEYRPRLGDVLQERRTTSVNWQGLPVTKIFLPKPATTPAPLRIVIDAGHGGKDTGATGPFGLEEKTLCLAIGKLVKRRLETEFRARKVPVQVLLSRGKDVFLSLSERVNLANSAEADLFVSIHANSSQTPRVHGFEVYFLNAEATDAQASRLAQVENAELQVTPLPSDVLSILNDVRTTHHVTESSNFAEVVYREMARTLRPNGRGVRQAPFTVLFGTTMPALLIEVGFVTNPEEAGLLAKPSYLKRLSNAISSGIVEFAVRMRRLG